MAILDYRGLPVRTSDLTKELADSSILSVRQPWFPSVATGLTPERLAAVVNAVDQNEAREYLTLAEEMEERDLHYSSVLRTRKLACTRLKIVVEASSDDAEDVKISDYVAEIAKGRIFKQLIAQQLDALGKGYSVSEIMWDRSEAQWEPTEFKWRDPRHFMFDRLTGQELRLIDMADLAYGVPLAPYKFIQHRPNIKMGLPIRGGLARLAVVAYMCKGYTLKDWLAFCEVFGMPLRVGKYPQNASPEQKSKLLMAVSNIGSDAAAIIPDSMVIDFVESARGTGGDTLFQGLADWWDSQVSKGVLGQTMTADNGSSMSQAQVHNEVREDIRDADAEELSATICRDVVWPIVDLNFGPRKPREYPILRLMFEEQEDLKLLAEAVTPFIDRGLRVAASQIYDKFGLDEPDAADEVLGPVVKAANPNDPNADPNAQDPNAQDPKAGQKKAPAAQDQTGAAQARDDAYAEVLRKVRLGLRLTTDQRTLFAAMSQQPDDAIDELARQELRGWKRVTDQLTEPIVELINSCSSYEEFKQKLSLLQLDPRELERALAVMTFKARGLGDATDKVR